MPDPFTLDEVREYERKRTELRQRARTHFERLKFGLMSSHPDEYVSIEPETGVYLVEEDFCCFTVALPDLLSVKVQPAFLALTRTGTCGRL